MFIIREGVFPISGIMKSMNSCGMVNGLLNLVNRYYLQKLEEQHTELASDGWIFHWFNSNHSTPGNFELIRRAMKNKWFSGEKKTQKKNYNKKFRKGRLEFFRKFIHFGRRCFPESENKSYQHEETMLWYIRLPPHKFSTPSMWLCTLHRLLQPVHRLARY